MKISRRVLLKGLFSSAATILGQRYGGIVEALKLPKSVLNVTSFTPKSAIDFYEMCEGVHWFLLGSETKTFELGDELNLSSSVDLTLSDIPNLSQQALLKAYMATVDNFHENVVDALHLLKYGDKLTELPQVMRQHKALIQKQDMFAEIDDVELFINQIEDHTGSAEKMNMLLNQIISENFRHLDALRRCMKSETVKVIASKNVFSLPGVNRGFSYMFDRKQVGAFVEAAGLKYNGVVLGQFDVSESFARLLGLSETSEEAKNIVAKHVLWGDEGFFNYELAHKQGLEERHFKQGLKDLIQENIQRQNDWMINDTDYLESDLHRLGRNFEEYSEEVDSIISEINEGSLKVFGLEENGCKIYRFEGSGDCLQRVSDSLDSVSELLVTLFSDYGYGLERRNAVQMILWTYEDWDGFYDITDILDNYVKQTEFAASFNNSPVQKLLRQVGWEGVSVSEIAKNARSLNILRL